MSLADMKKRLELSVGLDAVSGEFSRELRAARSPHCPELGLRRLAASSHDEVRIAVASNPSTPPDVLSWFVSWCATPLNELRRIAWRAAENPNTPREAVVEVWVKHHYSQALCVLASRPDTTDEQLREWSEHDDATVAMCAAEALRARVEALRESAESSRRTRRRPRTRPRGA